MQTSMVEECIENRGDKVAAKYAGRFGLESSFPGLWGLLSSHPSHLTGAKGEGSGLVSGGGGASSSAAVVSETFHMPLRVTIKDVSTPTELAACVAALAAFAGEAEAGRGPAAVVGIDAEWKPFKGSDEVNPVAVLQIATVHAVWLCDLIALDKMEHNDGGGASNHAADSEGKEGKEDAVGMTSSLADLWHLLRTRFIVAGFGLSGDLQRIYESYPSIGRLGGSRRANERLGVGEGHESIGSIGGGGIGCRLDRAVELQRVARALIAAHPDLAAL